MKTKRGIYKNIRDSDYFAEVDDITFYFTSTTYRDKFIDCHTLESDRFNQALNTVYKNRFNIIGDKLAWIRLYVLIEKRGFFIKLNGVELHCLEDLAFVVIPTYNNNYEKPTN